MKWPCQQKILLLIVAGLIYSLGACLSLKPLGICEALESGNNNQLAKATDRELNQIDLHQDDDIILQEIIERLKAQPCVKNAETGKEIVQTLPPLILINVTFIRDSILIEKTIDLTWTAEKISINKIQ